MLRTVKDPYPRAATISAPRGHSLVLIMTILSLILLAPTLLYGQAQGRLTLEQVRNLVNIGAPDATIAHEIQIRGIDFSPKPTFLDQLEKAHAGPQTISALRELLPVLEEAKKQIPKVLQTIYSALDQGNPSSVSASLTSDIANNPEKLDKICKPFTYRAHYEEAIIQRPNRLFEVRVRALFKPFEEKAYVLVFGTSQGHFLLQDIKPPTDWFTTQLTAAEELSRKFVYAAKAGRKDVLDASTLPGVDTSRYISDPKLKNVIQCIPVRAEDVQMVNYQGLKIELQMFSGASCDTWGTWKFLVDQFQGAARIACILWQTPDGKVDANCSPELEIDTLHRFKLETSSANVSPSPPDTTQNSSQQSVKSFTFQHRHINMLGPGDAIYYCTGNLVVSPDGSVRFDCTGTNDPTGRCDHVTFPAGSINDLKKKFGGFHVSARGIGNYDFFGDAASQQAAYQAIVPSVSPKK